MKTDNLKLGLSTKEIANNFRLLQDDYLADISLTGELYIEYEDREPKKPNTQ
jgi:hypothetical protein